MKTKKLLSLALTLIMILSVIVITPTASAVTLKSGNFQYTILGKNSVAIVKYTGKAKNLKIPSKIAGRNVTKLNNYCLESENLNGNKFTSVTIPDTVTTIGKYTLDNITIGTLTLGKKIKSFNISEIWVNKKIISRSKYYVVKSGIVYNKNMTKVLYCPRKLNIRNYTVPKTVKSICKKAFFCVNNLKTVKFNNQLTSIRESAFSNCKNINSIKITKNITWRVVK